MIYINVKAFIKVSKKYKQIVLLPNYSVIVLIYAYASFYWLCNSQNPVFEYLQKI